MKTFTNRQEAQIRKALDSLMRVGTAHIVLTCAVPKYRDDENGVQWWIVKAQVPYRLMTKTGEWYVDDKTYEISVGVTKDRRRHVYTALDMSQHSRHRQPITS